MVVVSGEGSRLERGMDERRDAGRVAALQRKTVLIGNAHDERPLDQVTPTTSQNRVEGKDPVRFRAL
ncbi:hypothetical protein [Paraburkholderia fungorum]|uniref:hypothetical protein n=1 Tax=Paraburkholderia fungorum TaxID=134537 RepID=UPI0011846932|nr:hypothetical protein [Paraburkholderia fungorum]USU18685.1 hypothetical protein NFE55_31485 [Paraburkholderia fungorum]USU29320.1 hypothetical protein NFS19_30085 [Paraburkholderia fungorum]